MSKKKTFSLGGIHLNKHKISSLSPIQEAGVPPLVFIPVKQHIGAPAQILVKAGDKVKIGTLLAQANGIVSANVHSSVAGEIKKIEEIQGENGYPEQVITIQTTADEYEEQIDTSDTILNNIQYTPEEIRDLIASAGIVGMGGAGFPTPVKTTIPENKSVQYLIINGIECEPYLTSDGALMLEKAEQIVLGAKILNKALGIQNAIIAVDENKPKAIEILNKITKTYIGVNVQPCATKYPQGGEKQLIAAITGHEVPSGKLPVDVGCVVQNVGTVFAIYEAITKNKPLYERVITVSGDACAHPGNFLVRIGTPISYLIEKTGGLNKNVAQVILGGPMMGSAVTNIHAPVTKLTSGILLLSEKLSHKEQETDCIRCGKCALVCPVGLEPFLIRRLMSEYQTDKLRAAHVQDCIECGCCAYTCPARIPLLDYCKLAKLELKKKK